MQIQVIAPCRQIAPINGRSAQAALAAKRRQAGQPGAQLAATQIFDLDRRDGVAHAGRRRFQRQADAIHIGAAATTGVEHLVGHRVVNHPQFAAAVAHQRHRDGKVGQAVDEVGGAVDWINHPQTIRVGLPQGMLFFRGHFFAQHRVGQDVRQATRQRLLSGQISLGEQGAVRFAGGTHTQKTRHDFGLRNLAQCLNHLIDHLHGTTPPLQLVNIILARR